MKGSGHITTDMKVPYIVLLTHGEWGKELIKGTEMVVGPIKNIFAFSLFSDQSVEKFLLEVKETINELPEGFIILTDLFCGTPSNVALLLSEMYHCHVISGLDMSMLIATDELRTQYKDRELTNKILERTINNCKAISEMFHT